MSTETRNDTPTLSASGGQVDLKLEVVVLPVSDVDRSAEFYGRLGWRVDADIKTDAGRLLQFTPPGSPCSIIIGTGLTTSPPGSTQWLHLIVSDIEAARADLISKGADAGEIYHDSSGGYNRWDPAVHASGLDPDRRTYASFLTFPDPDGNLWVLQEITTRFEGRVDAAATTFASATDLAAAMRRASVAHGEHEKAAGGEYDEEWPAWYAAYMVAEQAGEELPT
jgi:catechol 2,3-dioxygenase-like lactoylglutathione lyase family enzyme